MLTSGVSLSPNRSSPSLSVEYIDELVRKVNELIIANVVLRHSVRREMKDFNSEKLRQWITDPQKKWQDLPEKFKFNLPQSIDNLFHEFKNTIREELRIKPEQEQEVLIALIAKKAQEKSEYIFQSTPNWYENFSLKEPPSPILERAIKSVLSQPFVQSLDDMMLKQKFAQFWRAMDEGASTSPLIIQQLQKIFEIDKDSAQRIGSLFEKANPFKVKLAELLINCQLEKLNDCCKNRNVCFFDGAVLRSFKVEHVTKLQDSPPLIPHFILEGADGERVEFDVLIDSKIIGEGCWERKIQMNLSKAIDHLRKSEPRDLLEVKCDSHLSKFELSLEGDYRVLFENSKTTLDQAETEDLEHESVHSKPPPRKRRRLGRIVEGAKMLVDGTKNIFKSEKHYEDIIFQPILGGEIKNEGTIRFRRYRNNPNPHHFSLIIDGREKSLKIPLEIFFSDYTAKVIEVTPFQPQSKVYLTDFEPTTNDKIAKELKEHTEAELRAVDRLTTHNLESIYRFLIEREDEDLFSEKSELYDLMYHNIVDRDDDLKTQLFILCRLHKIAHQSKEEASILLNLIHRANIQQLCPGVKFSENPQLIKMLGETLDKSKNLSGKRGVILIGSTGSGKSTTACYLIGIPMDECRNRFGETIVKIKDEINTKDAPKLGFSLGISETTFAEQFALRSIMEKEGSGEFEEDVSVDFPPHIPRDTFFVLDFPGFKDSREITYRTATHFSIDHSIKEMGAIDAIGLVIAYDVLTAIRSSLFIDALRDLSMRFEGCMDDPVLAKRIFILVTKQPPNINRDHLQERAWNLLQDEEKQDFPDASKCRLLRFFMNQCEEQRVIPVRPLVPADRIDILNAMLESERSQSSNILPEQTLKHCYRTTLDNGLEAIKFSDSVNEAIGVWKDYAFPLFLDGIKKDIEDTEKKLSRVRQEIENKYDEIEKINGKNEKLSEEVEETNKILEALKMLQNGEDAQLPCDLSETIKQNQKKQPKIMKEKLESDTVRYDNALNGVYDCKIRLKERKGEVREIDDEINLKRQEIDQKTTGVDSRTLHDYNGEPFKVREWKPGIDVDAKWRRAINRGEDVLSGNEGEDYTYKDYNPTQPGKRSFMHIANIDRQHQLIPPSQGPDALNGLIQNQTTLILGKDGFKIHIESRKVKFVHIRHHRDGKQVTYGYHTMFDGQHPYPRLKITHVIPNSDLHKTEVQNLKNRISQLDGRKAGCLKALGEDRYNLGQAKRELQAAEQAYLQIQAEKREFESKAYQETINSSLEQYEKQLSRIEMKIKSNEERKINLEDEIKTSTQSIKEYCDDLNNNKFKRQRWGLFIKNHREELEHAINMARFFVETNEGKRGEDGVSEKLVRISEECKRFIQLYVQRKDELEENLKQCFEKVNG